MIKHPDGLCLESLWCQTLEMAWESMSVGFLKPFVFFALFVVKKGNFKGGGECSEVEPGGGVGWFPEKPKKGRPR
jgi:hypothetical protein